MSDVSVVGAGAMGGALAQVLAAAGADVAIWNRTVTKAQALIGPRLHIAESVAASLSSSPLTVLSVSDHEVARTLLAQADVDLRGRVVASTSPVSPDQASALAATVSAGGGSYLDLAILGSASEVRSGAGVFLLSGDRAAYATHCGWFEQIGTAAWVDDQPGAAYVSGTAVVLGFLPLAVGLLTGRRVCAQHMVSAEWFEKAVVEFYPRQNRLLLHRVIAMPNPSASDVEGSIDVMGDWAAELSAFVRAAGLDSGLHDAVLTQFAAASAAGHGDAAWTRIAEYTADDPHR